MKKLWEKCKTIWTKTEELKKVDSNSLSVFDDRYIKKQNKNVWW